ncbi:MAG: hypothetical protein U1C53_00335, partial [Candidatus Veblenbacteria bacterium]|nr:hypothetical protein [Candidatus Veblenbacteria bacterium]
MSYVRYIGISLGVAVSAMFFVVWAQPVAAAPTCVGFSGSLTSVCTLTAQAIDPEGDQVYYVYSWGDGSADTRMPASGFVASGTQVSADHTWNTAGSWTIRVYAYDEANHQSTASDPVLVTITSAVLSASLSGTPSSSGWYNYATFDYTTGCAANSGQTLSYCRTQVSINSGSWNNVPGGNPSTTGQSTYTYNGSYTFATNGASYRFRSTADDTGASPVVFSATVPSSGQIQVDQSFPFAAASSPPGNQSSSFIVSATLVDYPIPAPGVGNSGVSTWDLQYRANSSGAWTNCRTSIVAGQTSLNFGSGCSPAVTLVANTTYCFRARARDSTSPTQNESSYTAAANGDSCTPYQVNAAPYMPSNPNPVSAASTLAPANTNLSWDGGDPEGGSDTVTYSVYTGTTNPPSVLNGTQVAFGNQTPITYNPLSNFLAGSQYYWRVVAQDAASNITTGPVWTFTVNTAPSVTNVSIVPNGATPVNTTATITWNATDPNSSQSLGFSVYYGPSSGSLATLIASGLTPASAGCSGSPNNYTNCTYTWSSSCAPEISTAQYVTVVASDGLNSGLGSSVSTFPINHTETKYYPTSGFNTANDRDTVNFT